MQNLHRWKATMYNYHLRNALLAASPKYKTKARLGNTNNFFKSVVGSCP